MLLLLIACVGNPVITPSTEGCQNYDFDDPQDSKIESSVKGDKADVYRSFVERENLDDAFDPEIVADGNVIEVHEAWVPGSDGNATCLEPHVLIEEFEATIEVRWFTPDDDNVPVDTVNLTPE